MSSGASKSKSTDLDKLAQLLGDLCHQLRACDTPRWVLIVDYSYLESSSIDSWITET